MKQCLITKLKASVDNIDLPVLETMQQVTLDAIARGGNMELTEGQKMALNHFFYAIGAVENTSLWGKVHTLLIPLIGVDKSHVLVDHKDPSTTFTNTTIIKDQGGSLEYNSPGYNSSAIIINGKDLSSPLNYFGSSILACTTPDSTIEIGSSSQIGFVFVDSSSNQYNRLYNSSENFISAEARKSTDIFSSRLYETPASVAVCTFERAHNKIYAISGSEIVREQSTSFGSAQNLPDTITATGYKLGIASLKKYGIVADFSDALTEDEAIAVISAANMLRNSFA